SEPYRATRTVATCGIRPSSARPLANIPAAFIGPTVCELDGPMPTLNRSKTLMAIWQYSVDAVVSERLRSDRRCAIPGAPRPAALMLPAPARPAHRTNRHDVA